MFSEISAIIKELGIKKSDIVLLHLNTDFFEDVADKNKKECAEALLKSMLDVIGEDGVLLTPAFNYSFCKSGKFNLQKTPSQVGYFSNFLLTKNNSQRSSHPIFSFVGVGKNTNKIFENLSRDAFGEDSIFDRLHTLGAKGLYINLPMDSHDDCPPSTFIHYIEQKFGVKYRYLKTFEGEITDGEKVFHNEFTYNVRDLNLEVKADNIKLYQNALQCEAAKIKLLHDKYPIVVIGLKPLVNVGISMLEKNPYALLLKNPYSK